MPRSFQLLLNGQPADSDLTSLLVSLDVEESMDMPGAARLVLPVGRSQTGDLTFVSDARFVPLAPWAVVATAGQATSSGASAAIGAAASVFGGASAPGAQCIFDGYILSQNLHLETGATNSTLAVWGQDASWLMNLTETVKEWIDVTDADVANSIFGDYGITPADDNTSDDSPSHTEDGHSLMQRASDIAFLRMLARRNGKMCRVTCADTPGQRTGVFAKPTLDGDPVCSLTLNDPANWTVNKLDIDWDVTRPTSVVARQALFTDANEDGASGDTDDSGFTTLGDRGLSDFSGKPMTVLLAAPVDDAGELTLRAQALLRDADWFVRCEGESDVDRLGVVLRAGSLVSVDGVGALHSGKYLLWNVRHHITTDAHTMTFQLVRNAVGARS